MHTIVEMGVVKGNRAPFLKSCFLVDHEVKVAGALDEAIGGREHLHALHCKLHVQGGGCP